MDKRAMNIRSRRGGWQAVVQGVALFAVLAWAEGAEGAGTSDGGAGGGERTGANQGAERVGSPDAGEQVRRLLEQGVAAIDAGDFSGALSPLREAWRLKKSYDIAAALSQAELELGQFREAAGHLHYALTDYPPAGSREVLAHLQAAYSRARQEVAMVHVTADRAGAELVVNGTRVGTTPLEGPLFLGPGRYVFRAHTPRASSAEPTLVSEQVLDAGAGEERSIALQLRPEPTRAPQGSATDSQGARSTPPEAEREPGSYAPAAAAAAAGVAGLAAGITLLVKAHQYDTDRERVLKGLSGENRCGSGTVYAAECRDIEAWADKKVTYRVLSGVGFGAFVAGGVAAYALWPRERGPRTLGLSVAPARRAKGVEVVVAGSFGAAE